MGTNYYAIDDSNVCPHCGHGEQEIHIGKSSFGWHFSLHVGGDLGLNTLDEWKQFLICKQIRSEYGQEITFPEMLKIITDRRADPPQEKPLGYTSWEQFLEMNHAEQGLNNLLRHKIGRHCIGHGEGTWDYIQGEFS